VGKLDGINKESRQMAVTTWTQASRCDCRNRIGYTCDRVRIATSSTGLLCSQFCNTSLLQTCQQKCLLHITLGPKLVNHPFTDFFTPLSSLAAIRSDEGVLPPPSLIRDTQVDLLNLLGLDNDDPKVSPGNLIM
jgi:hypothetical protein